MRVATFDIETNGLLDTVDTVWCAVVKGIAVDGVEGFVERFTPKDIHHLPDYLNNFDELRGHNCIGYDFPILRKLFGWEYKGRKVDTLLMSRLQRPLRKVPPNCLIRTGPHSVAAWGYRLGHQKVEHDEWDKYSPEMLHRCAEDVGIQEEIYDALIKEGEGEGWDLAHRINNRMFHYLEEQENTGWPVDLPKLDAHRATLQRWMDKVSAVTEELLPIVLQIDETKKDGVYNYVKKPFKKDGKYSANTVKYMEVAEIPNSVWGIFSRVSFRLTDLDKPAEVKAYLLSDGWVPEEWNTNNTGERTSPKMSIDDPFNGVSTGVGKLIAKRVQCKQRLGTLNGWHDQLRPDGRLSAMVGGLAVTGRLRHKQIVNVPSPETGSFFAKQMRSIFITKPGWVIVGVDSMGNQVRQLAARMNDEEFTNAVLFGKKEDGTDIHSVNMRKSGTATRTLAKNFFYGFTFGAGDTKVGSIIGGSREDGKALKEKYFEELPGLKRLIDESTKEWRGTATHVFNKKWNKMEYRNGYIKGLDGRPIQVDSEHKILVSILQSDEAIQMSAAYIKFNDDLGRAGYTRGVDYEPYIWMHDEFQVGCRPDISGRVGELAAQSITWAGNYFKIACPHEGEINIGNNWGETH